MTERRLGRHVTILCEDPETGRFAEWLLKHCGARRDEVSTIPVPTGKGSGKAHVTDLFPRELSELRRMRARRAAALLVITDADELTTAKRRSQLAKALSNDGVSPPDPDDNLLLLVPKWEIETWFLVLRDERMGILANAPWTESESYKRKADGIAPKEAAAVFLEFAQSNRDENVLRERFPSLTEGIDAFRGW